MIVTRMGQYHSGAEEKRTVLVTFFGVWISLRVRSAVNVPHVVWAVTRRKLRLSITRSSGLGLLGFVLLNWAA